MTLALLWYLLFRSMILPWPWGYILCDVNGGVRFLITWSGVCLTYLHQPWRPWAGTWVFDLKLWFIHTQTVSSSCVYLLTDVWISVLYRPWAWSSFFLGCLTEHSSSWQVPWWDYRLLPYCSALALSIRTDQNQISYSWLPSLDFLHIPSGFYLHSIVKLEVFSLLVFL